MGEPAIGSQERQLRTHLPKDYMVAPLSEVHPEIGRIIAAALGGGFESEREALLERSRYSWNGTRSIRTFLPTMWAPVIAFRTTRRTEGGIYRWKRKHAPNNRS
jgi:hypothetical protein